MTGYMVVTVGIDFQLPYNIKAKRKFRGELYIDNPAIFSRYIPYYEIWLIRNFRANWLNKGASDGFK